MTQDELPIVFPTPPLKWAGGKRWLIDEISKWYEPGRRLVDPFVGAMSVPLGLKAKNVLLSDVNPHLMNFHRSLMIGLLKTEDYDHIEFRNDQHVYYRNREMFNSLCSTGQFWTVDGALLFYYLNRTCFNGLCRFNSRGEFNVPFGRYKSINYNIDFRSYMAPMKEWTLMSGDFESLPTKPDDFIYADPPYDVEFTRFAQRDFSWDDQLRLASWLSKHQGPVVTSNQATPRIVDLYKRYGFEVYGVSGPRNISSSGDRTPAQEILAVKRAR